MSGARGEGGHRSRLGQVTNTMGRTSTKYELENLPKLPFYPINFFLFSDGAQDPRHKQFPGSITYRGVGSREDKTK